MKFSLTYKFFLNLLLAIGVVVAGMYFLIQYTFDRGFLNYVNTIETERFNTLADNLETAYSTTYVEQGNWDAFRRNYRLWGNFLDGSLPVGSTALPKRQEINPGRPGEPRRQPPAHLGPGKAAGRSGFDAPVKPQLFEHRVVLMDGNKNTILGPPDHPENMLIRALMFDGQQIGYLGIIPQHNLTNELQLSFAAEQKRTFAVIALIMVCLAALLSLPLARRMVKRIRKLAEATHQLASGRYDTRLHAGSTDELDKLTHDFNTLAGILEENEKKRRQWVGDISHELRTPLAVLRGEIEALQDNIRPATPESLDSLHSEVMQLGRLVDDLYQLSMSDIGALNYRKDNVELVLLLNEAVDSFLTKFASKNISVTRDLSLQKEIYLFGDSDRLKQLFDNLLANSLKYTDPAGQFSVKLDMKDEWVTVLFEDSAPGVGLVETQKLFDRLYRVESSRNRALGGAGLGLAISKSIVEAHGGTITAKPSDSGGLLIIVHLPLKGVGDE